MRANKSKNTGPERRLGSALRRVGLRPKRHDRLRPGTPDFSFPSRKLAIFVDGLFWHGLATIPKTNTAWWEAKFARTRERDARNQAALIEMGWAVLRFTETDVKKHSAEIAAQVAVRLSA